jgi:hypothetical protein
LVPFDASAEARAIILEAPAKPPIEDAPRLTLDRSQTYHPPSDERATP